MIFGVRIDEVRNNTEAFKQAVMLRAQALAGEELAAEKYKEAIQKRTDAEKKQWTGIGGSWSNLTREQQKEAESRYNQGKIDYKAPRGTVRTGARMEAAGNAAAQEYINGIRKGLNDEATALEAEADRIIGSALNMGESAREKLRNAGIMEADGGTSGSSSDATREEERKQKAIADARLKAKQEADKAELDLERSRITDKIKLLEFDKEQELKAIDERIAATKDAEEKAELERKRTATETGYNERIDKARLDADEELYRSLTERYQSYTDQRLSIEEKFDEDIAALQEARKKAEEQGDTERVSRIDRSIAKATADKGKALAGLDYEILKRSPEYVKAFEDLSTSTDGMLKSLIRKFEDAKEQAAEVLDPQDLKSYTDTIQQMQDELDRRNPFKTLTEALKEIEDAQGDIGKAQDIVDRLKDGQTVINEATGEAYTMTQAEERLEEARERGNKASTRLLKATEACSQSFSRLSGTLTQLGGAIGGKFGNSIGEIGGIVGSFGDAFSSLKNINVNAKGLEKGIGIFSAVAGVATAMFSMNKQLNKLLPDADSLYSRYANRQREINEAHMAMIELEFAQLEQRLNAESWFYENGLTQLKKSAELNAEYIEGYGKVAAMPQEIYKNKKSGLAKLAPAILGVVGGIVAGVLTFGAGTGLGATLGASLGSALGATLSAGVITALGTALFAGVGGALGNAVSAGISSLTYKKGQTAAINNMRVQTRHRTLFHGEKTQDLQSWVKENWGEDLFEDVKGVRLVDPEVAKKLLEGNVKLVGETRDTLEKLTEYSEKIREFVDQVREYVSETFGPLVDNLTEALWDWLTEGKDVMDSFREYAADTFKGIAQDALKAMIQKNIFEPFQEQLEDLTIAYSTGDMDEAAYMAAVAEFARKAQESIETQLPVLQNAAQVMEEAMKGAGIDITGSESGEGGRTATAKGIAQASQDSVDELNGRFTAIQGHTFQINENVTKLAELQQMHLPLLQNLSYLAPIEENTYYCRRLDGMDADLRAMRHTLEDIQLKGITVRP